MGQQQLLLVVLGIVIVGLAFAAGVHAFDANQTQSQQDALLQKGLRIATDVQSYALKPAPLGGGGGSLPSSLEAIGLSGDPYQTPWGEIAYDPSGTLTLDAPNAEHDAVITVSAGDPQPRLSTGWDGNTIPE